MREAKSNLRTWKNEQLLFVHVASSKYAKLTVGIECNSTRPTTCSSGTDLVTFGYIWNKPQAGHLGNRTCTVALPAV